MKKFAIIGAGFSGMALSWHLRKIFPNAIIDLFDKKPIGENTSGISTGLLHGFLGKSSKKSLYADLAIESALLTLNAAQRHSDEKIYTKGLIKLALDEKQEHTLTSLAKKYNELSYLNNEQVNQACSNLISHKGVFIKNAISVNPVKYLKNLFLDLKCSGINFYFKDVEDGDLKGYDIKVYCTGHNIDGFKAKFSFEYEKIKGQMLICKWPDSLPKLKFSISGNGHITVLNDICYLGATYERFFKDDNVDQEAYSIIDKIKSFFPLVEKLKIIDSKAGIRVKRKGHYFPSILSVSENSYLFSCLGSRGLLYHSYLASKLALAIKENNDNHIPKECLAPNS